MDNWLLIIVGVIFLISIVAGYVRGLLKNRNFVAGYGSVDRAGYVSGALCQ